MSTAWARGSTTRWRTIRALVLARDHYLCQIRGPGCTGTAPLKGGHVDHIITKEDGGSDDPSNLRAACAACNLGRSTPGPGDRIQHRSVTDW